MRNSIAIAGALILAACGGKEPAPANPAAEQAGAGISAAGPDETLARDGAANLTATPSAVVGANIFVEWTGPGNSGDYVDVVPRGFAEMRDAISYAYVKESSGKVSVRAPTTPGDYDIRYVLDLNGKKSVKVVSPLTVTPAASTLKGPEEAKAGEEIQVEWTGPNGPGDYIDLVKAGVIETRGEITSAYVSAGSPAKVEAPSAAGDYLIRYVLEGPGGRKVAASAPLTVTMPKATLSAPARVTKGKAFKVKWTGPRSSGDYVDLVKKGQTATSGQVDSFNVASGKAGELTAKARGDYVIRYVLDAPGGRVVLATRAVTVR